MISIATKENILAVSRIEEVVGDFVNLKKRGTNFVGLCPFHTEKTPSFHVSPSKGIYKCFGCGKGGDAVSFVMEHEKFNYPEALRYLAQKFNVAVEETEDVAKDQGESMVKESLYIINQFAQQYYHDNLLKTQEGKTVGLSYFKERGFTEEMKKKFMLGYALSDSEAFIKTALKNGYQQELLKQAGLIVQKGTRDVDFFHHRVIFPILNLSGKVVAFAARIMVKDDRAPKYINSPETDIYHKSQLLYGIYQGRNAIRKEDECFLTEGYTDVISMHQAGIENVVASSGTSLTVEQIRLIRRFTNNITILYDGDPAGIKAALRGVDLMATENVNVRVVLLPDNDDPDSFLHKNGNTAFREFIRINKKDFVLFKVEILLAETNNDPLKKAEVIKEIAKTLASIPDIIKRSVLLQECSKLLSISEQILITEMNIIRRQLYNKTKDSEPKDEYLNNPTFQQDLQSDNFNYTIDYWQERGMVRVILDYGNLTMKNHQRVIDFLFDEIMEVPIINPRLRLVMNEIKDLYNNKLTVDTTYFINHKEENFRNIIIEIVCSPYELHNWNKYEIYVPSLVERFNEDVESTLLYFKLHKWMGIKQENRLELKKVIGDIGAENHYLRIQRKIELAIMELAKSIGLVSMPYFRPSS